MALPLSGGVSTIYFVSIRNISFAEGEIYHIFNRGVDKRDIFLDQYDLQRFFQAIQVFNTLKPIGSIYASLFSKKEKSQTEADQKLVEIICYCLNPNHFHLVLKQVFDGGISKFMHRLAGGYSRYFNEKNQRSGSLFQGKFKAKHVDTNNYLLHLSTYVNLNNQIHPKPQSLSGKATKLSQSSWEEYVEEKNGICKKDIVLDQFRSVEEYKKFAEESLGDITKRKELEKITT